MGHFRVVEGGEKSLLLSFRIDRGGGFFRGEGKKRFFAITRRILTVQDK